METLWQLDSVAKLSDTEAMLLAIYGAPVIRIDLIAKEYLSLEPRMARELAALNKLPFPTFRLRNSQKAPVLVAISDLASHIDRSRNDAALLWQKSQSE